MPYADYQKAYEAARQNVTNRYQQSVNQLNEQNQQMQPQWQQQRDQVYNTAAQTGRQLDNMAADRGLYRGGGAMSQQAGLMSGRNANINEISRNEQNYNTQYANRLSELLAQKQTGLDQLEGLEGMALREDENRTWQQQQAMAQLAAQLWGQYGQGTGNYALGNQWDIAGWLENFLRGLGGGQNS